MKKVIRIILLLLATALIAFLVISIYQKIQAKKIAEQKIARLPNFSFSTITHASFANTDLQNYNGRIMINYFNPECEHCQYMAQSFVHNAQKLKDVQLLMITFADSAKVAQFKNDYHLDSLPNLILLLDKKFEFSKIFGASVVPSFFVYNKGRLVKKIIGETKIENLLSDQ